MFISFELLFVLAACTLPCKLIICALQAICSYKVYRGADYAVTKVERGCSKPQKCSSDSIGPDAEVCENLANGHSVCETCSYGAETTERDSFEVSDCVVPGVPSRYFIVLIQEPCHQGTICSLRYLNLKSLGVYTLL